MRLRQRSRSRSRPLKNELASSSSRASSLWPSRQRTMRPLRSCRRRSARPSRRPSRRRARRQAQRRQARRQARQEMTGHARCNLATGRERPMPLRHQTFPRPRGDASGRLPWARSPVRRPHRAAPQAMVTRSSPRRPCRARCAVRRRIGSLLTATCRPTAKSRAATVAAAAAGAA